MIKTLVCLSQWCTAISWAFTVIHEWFILSKTPYVSECTSMQGTRVCRLVFRLNGFVLIFFSAHASRSRIPVTLHSLAIPAAHCVLTEGRAGSAFCLAICTSCPRPLTSRSSTCQAAHPQNRTAPRCSLGAPAVEEK